MIGRKIVKRIFSIHRFRITKTNDVAEKSSVCRESKRKEEKEKKKNQKYNRFEKVP